MTETDVEVTPCERTLDVSPNVLARICPENGLASKVVRSSRLQRLTMAAKVRCRLFWTRVRFRFDDFQAIRCFVASKRLRLRLLWLKLRHRNNLSR